MSDRMIQIEGSGKHCHVKRETLDILFGEGFEMEIKSMLSQPGQYATPHKVTLVGPRRSAEVTILGPCRKADQVEISRTDATLLGFVAPLCESGELAGSTGCTLIGPKGEVVLNEGVMIAKRHIHMTPEDADRLDLEDKQIVKVKINGERALIFDEVVVRVSPDFATFMHVDYDELNAAAITHDNAKGEIL
ncbi:MAG: phosphate propanoyltransferase [Oscillospiraceae bacterium]|jgi:putative phosphotransacetylase|nr:phosphate propanoyltransferase [Oscillospiraceae bacterium]